MRKHLRSGANRLPLGKRGWSGHDVDAAKHYDAVQDLAAAKGVRYLPLDQVVKLPIDSLLERIETIANRNQTPGRLDAAAVLGTKKPPALTVTQALETYWTLAKDKTFGKSEDQKRRWENPRKKAVRNFVSVVGDKPINEITADDMLEFRSYWQERIETGGLTANSANKALIHLGEVLKTVNKMKRLGVDLPLDGLAFKEGEKTERPPFSDDWIRSKLLAPDQFCLEADIPHMFIKPREGRTIKNKNSKRIIPLVGVSFEAMRAFPNGHCLRKS